MAYLKINRGVYYYRRRVPKRYLPYVKNPVVEKTTRRTDKGEAGIIVKQINAETEALWRALEAGASPDAVHSYEAALDLARDLGFSYKPAEEVAGGPLTEILERLGKLEEVQLVQAAPAVSAVLGGEDQPAIRISDVFDHYKELVKAEIVGKSPNQLRKWEHPRRRAFRNLVDVIGDKVITDISRTDALQFRAWWVDRVVDEGLKKGSANKDIQHINKAINTLDDLYQLDLGQPFAGTRLKGAADEQRIAYERDFVQQHILLDGALDSLNLQARMALYVVAGLGMRPSEVVNLDQENIHLDTSIPFVEVRPAGRDIKSRAARRDIPLVGLALHAMRRVPNGFPNYRDKEDTLSATINKSLSTSNLRPTPDHSLYSLRHTFQDLLTAAEAPARIEKDLMGHALDGPRYGRGPSLEQKARWLEKIGYEVPASLMR